MSGNGYLCQYNCAVGCSPPAAWNRDTGPIEDLSCGNSYVPDVVVIIRSPPVCQYQALGEAAYEGEILILIGERLFELKHGRDQAITAKIQRKYPFPLAARLDHCVWPREAESTDHFPIANESVLIFRSRLAVLEGTRKNSRLRNRHARAWIKRRSGFRLKAERHDSSLNLHGHRDTKWRLSSTLEDCEYASPIENEPNINASAVAKKLTLSHIPTRIHGLAIVLIVMRVGAPFFGGSRLQTLSL